MILAVDLKIINFYYLMFIVFRLDLLCWLLVNEFIEILRCLSSKATAAIFKFMRLWGLAIRFICVYICSAYIRFTLSFP